MGRRICGNPFIGCLQPLLCHLTPPDSMIELNGGFLRLGAYRVEGVNTMYIGAGNPLGSIQAQTGRWVNQNMSLKIIPLIELPL